MKHRSPQFIAMKKAEKSNAEIAAVFNVRPRTIDWWVTSAIKEGLLEPMRGRKKTDETTLSRLRELWDAGLHIDDITQELGRSIMSVRGLLNRHNMVRDLPPVRKKREQDPSWLPTIERMKLDGKSDTEIAVHLGISKSRVARLRLKSGVVFLTPKRVTGWDSAAENELRRLWPTGLSCYLIGQQMNGRTASQIMSKANRMGLPPKGMPVRRKVADRDYASVSAAAAARKGTPLGPRAKRGPAEDPAIIPDYARPWLSRAFGECAYPYGPRYQIHSCCKPVFGLSKWCEAHHALCTVERRAAA
jgi:hypothetical protein